MLIPSIDLLGGRIVQLVQGEKLCLAFDDFEYWIEKFARYPLVQLIDLDAAMRQTSPNFRLCYYHSPLLKFRSGKPGHDRLSHARGYGGDAMEHVGWKCNDMAPALWRGNDLGSDIELEVAAFVARRIGQLNSH